MGTQAKIDGGRVAIHIGQHGADPSNKIVVDGLDITHIVRRIVLDSEAGEMTKLELYLVPREVWADVVSKETIVTVDSIVEKTRPLLLPTDNGSRPDGD